MTQLEIASRAAAGALGMNPATEWERAKPVAEAVLAAVAGRETAEEIVQPGLQFRLDAAHTAIAHANDPARRDERLAAQGLLGRETSPEVASIAARGVCDPLSLLPTEIQSVCASALVQR